MILIAAKTVLLVEDGCLTCGKKPDDTMIFRCVHHIGLGIFHVHCVPFDLPKSVELHHRLTFTEKYFDPVSSGVTAMSAGIWRDPEHPLFHCSECKFSAHATCSHCGLSMQSRVGWAQVLASLTAEWRAGGGQRRRGWRHSFLPDDYYHLKGDMEGLYRERASQKYWVESLTNS